MQFQKHAVAKYKNIRTPKAVWQLYSSDSISTSTSLCTSLPSPNPFKIDFF